MDRDVKSKQYHAPKTWCGARQR